MHELTLTEDEATAMRELAGRLAARWDTAEDPQFLQQAAILAHELPLRLRQHLYEFKLNEPVSALCRISGMPVDDAEIGPTPRHWKDRARPSQTHLQDLLLVMMGSLLGEAIGWASQQDGYIVHDILPIPGHENEQLGSGSEQLLWWHTEDAFHPLRGDYIGLLCLRNPDGVATTYANLADLRLSDEDVDLLFSPHYTIRPDESHLRKNQSGNKAADALLEKAFRRIEQMQTHPEKIALFTGDRHSPYLRIDPYFMDPVPDPRAQAALDRLIAAIEASLQEVVLQPGELCFIDNFKAVHGRRPFRARYDGNDRWLKRLNVTRDLRRSRDCRLSAAGRVIH